MILWTILFVVCLALCAVVVVLFKEMARDSPMMGLLGVVLLGLAGWLTYESGCQAYYRAAGQEVEETLTVTSVRHYTQLMPVTTTVGKTVMVNNIPVAKTDITCEEYGGQVFTCDGHRSWSSGSKVKIVFYVLGDEKKSYDL